jgi:ABC-type transport system involved in multi-copper enzyme maturation permease subunit
LGNPQLGIARPSPTEWPHSEALDWLFVLRVVLPLVAFILGYDAFSSHRSRQRLRLTLAQPLARFQVLAAKGLALWMLLAAFLLLGTILALPFLHWGGELKLTAQELGKIALSLGIGCWAAALFSLLALLVSTLSRTSTDSLAIAALLWVTLVVVIPAVAHLLAQMIRPLPGEEEMAQRFREVQREFLTQEGAPRSWRRPEMAAVDNFASERQAAAAETRRFERQEALRQDLIRRQFAQVALARRLSLTSPMWLVQDVIERLLGTGSYRDQRFIEQAHAFRAHLAAQVRALDQADPQSPHLLFFSDYLSKRPVLAADVPCFTLAEASLSEGLRLARGRVVDLLVWTLVLLLVHGVAFTRLQVG